MGAARDTRDPSVAGRVVVVTGAAGGIGGAACRLLSDLGARIVATDIVDVDLDRCLGTLGPTEARAIAADLADADGARSVVDLAVDAFGRVDALVSAAGIYRMASAAEQDLDEARRVIEINVLGALNIGVQAMARMGPGSSIVNFTSGAQWGMRNMAVYAASKGAIASLTYAWALDMAAHGIRVNAVSPTAATGMTEVLFDALGLTPVERDERRSRMPSPAAVAPLVAYLVSNRSADVTGQVVRIDDGRLSIVGHPAVVAPVLERPAWSVAEIDDAMSHALSLQPVGMGDPIRQEGAEEVHDAHG